MKTIVKLLELINAARRKQWLAGERNGTWSIGRIFAGSSYQIREIESITGAPEVDRLITPELSTRKTICFLQGALIALDPNNDAVWDLTDRYLAELE